MIWTCLQPRLVHQSFCILGRCRGRLIGSISFLGRMTARDWVIGCPKIGPGSQPRDRPTCCIETAHRLVSKLSGAGIT